MARTTATNFSGGLQFPYATSATDVFKKEDVQTLALAVDGHDHTPGKGHSINTVPANASITNAMLASDVARASLLTNGGFEIWQRGNGPFAGNGTWSADRWQNLIAGTDTLSVSRDTTNIDSASGSRACAAVTFVLGTGAGGTYLSGNLGAPADGAQVFNRVLSLSIRVRTATANAVRIALYSGAAFSYSAYHSGSGVYETLTVTATMGPSAGNTAQAFVNFAASCTAYVDNAMLVVGSQAADYAPLHPADDLARCLRYYEKVGPSGGLPELNGYQVGGNQFLQTLSWAAKKVVTPTVTAGGTFAFSNATGVQLQSPNSDGVVFGATATATGSAVVYSNNSGYITAESNP